MKRQYYWDRWFSQHRIILTRGKDYDCHEHTFIQQMRNAASKRGVSLQIEIQGASIVATVIGRDHAKARR